MTPGFLTGELGGWWHPFLSWRSTRAGRRNRFKGNQEGTWGVQILEGRVLDLLIIPTSVLSPEPGTQQVLISSCQVISYPSLLGQWGAALVPADAALIWGYPEDLPLNRPHGGQSV